MNTNLNVLIVDDEIMIRDAVSAYFSKMGCNCFLAENGQAALDTFGNNKIDFIILDLMLPGLSGEDVCKQIRMTSSVPVIMLTAKTQEDSIINGLSIGADDYVTKPFSVKQLYARMKTIMRRVSTGREVENVPESSANALVINFDLCEVIKKGAPISLTKSEWKLISSMASYPKKVFTRAELMEIVFGDESDSFDRVIDTHIKNLRKKIEDDPKNPIYIKTVHGMGYKFGGHSL